MTEKVVYVNRIIDYNKNKEVWYVDYVIEKQGKLIVKQASFFTHNGATNFYNEIVKA